MKKFCSAWSLVYIFISTVVFSVGISLPRYNVRSQISCRLFMGLYLSISISWTTTNFYILCCLFCYNIKKKKKDNFFSKKLPTLMIQTTSIMKITSITFFARKKINWLLKGNHRAIFFCLLKNWMCVYVIIRWSQSH